MIKTALRQISAGYYEFVFVSYLLSGIIKEFFVTKNIHLPIDFTLLTIGAMFIPFLFQWKYLYAHRDELWEKLRRIGFLFVFYLWCIITLYYSPSDSFGLKKAALFGTNIIAITYPLLVRRFSIPRFTFTFLSFTFVFGIYAIFAYGDYFGHFENWLNHNLEFYQSFYLDAGYTLGVSSLLSLFITRHRLNWVIFPIFFSLTLATAARGPIIFTTISLFLLILLKLFDRPPKEWPETVKKWIPNIAISLGTFAVVISIIYTSPYGKISLNRAFYRFSLVVPEDPNMAIQQGLDHARFQNGQFNNPAEEALNPPEKSSLARIEHFTYSFQMIKKSWKTFFFGYGLGSYGIVKTGEDKRLYPHNIFLEILFELGLIGFIWFALFLIIGVYWTIQNNQHILLFCLLFLIANTLKSYSLVDHRIFMGFFGLSIFVHHGTSRLKLIQTVKNKI